MTVHLREKRQKFPAFLVNERANLVDKSVGDERVSVDKIKNHQEMNMPVLEKTVHASPAEKPLSMRKKRFEL